MERRTSKHPEAILESLLKLGIVVPISQARWGMTRQKKLAAQGMQSDLREVLARESSLNENQIHQLNDIENIIPRYTLWEKVTEGKLGVVYKARQHSLNRWVAIKMLNPELIASEESVQHFLREINARGKLDHPNILHALDSGQIQDIYYLVTEYFDGIILNQYIKIHGPMSENQMLQMGSKLASALTHIWNCNMIHRDIVPENIMVSQDNIKLCDLGLIKVVSKNAQFTPYPIPRRSYSYIPPEQIQKKDLDYRSDIYSLGAVLYFAVTGHQTIENWKYDLEDSLNYVIVPIEKHAPHVSQDTRNLIGKMLSFSREHRAKSPQELIGEFDYLLEKKSCSKKLCFIESEHGISPRFMFMAIILSILCLICCYCVFIFTKESAESKLSPSEIFAQCSHGVVVIQAGDLLGSGVIVYYGQQNWIITNAHLVKDKSNVQVILKDGRKFSSKVLNEVESMDLALVVLPPEIKETVALPMACFEDIQVGQDVFVIGHPKGYYWSLTRGTISGIRDDTLQTDASINVGNSGGPLLDTKGRMVGMTTYTIGKSPPIGFAISTKRIQKFLKISIL